MSIIPFVKYTHCGNNFVIVDELSKSRLSEQEKPVFACQASDVNFGIGSDGLLVIQPFNSKVLQEINNTYGYWDVLPATLIHCNYIFRLFESNKKEALSCGNGLLCISSYLHQRYGIENANLMTEIPLAQPNIVEVGIRQEEQLYWCNLGFPRRVPNHLVPHSGIEYYKEQIDIVYGLKIGFRSHDLHSFAEDTPLLLSCYLCFTGEPHLVIFPDECMPAELAGTMFASFEANQREKRRNFGNWLVSHIGAYINKHYRDRFPFGINVNFARVLSAPENIIQYRCYERGINRETLACGTGAIAVSHIATILRLITGHDKITIIPYLCDYYEPNTKISVTVKADGIQLSGKPKTLFAGKFIHRA